MDYDSMEEEPAIIKVIGVIFLLLIAGWLWLLLSGAFKAFTLFLSKLV